jgi:hypothetical protein
MPNQAAEDLIDIWLYITPDNPGTGDRLLDEIMDTQREGFAKEVAITPFSPQ